MPELLEKFEQGEPVPGTRCEHGGYCSKEKWRHPTKGVLCCCKTHSFAIVSGAMRAPRINPYIQPITHPMRLFFSSFDVEELKETDR